MIHVKVCNSDLYKYIYAFFFLSCGVTPIPENLRLPRQSLHKDQDLNFNLCWVKHCILLECIKGEKGRGKKLCLGKHLNQLYTFLD